MKVSVVSYSLLNAPESLADWENKLFNEIEQLALEADIILYPELFLMGLSDYFSGDLKKQFSDIAVYVYQTLLPKLSSILSAKNILLCLGSGPRLENNKLYNACPIWLVDRWIYQDKIHLTPWETELTPGREVNIFEFNGIRVACVICFDIEQPGLALFLKKAEVDLILCPAATANLNGNQRVNRCASARAVELGCAVFTAPLVGQSACELIDHNEGRQGVFLPAQETVTIDQERFSAYSTGEHIVQHYQLDNFMLKELKKRDGETKPYFQEDFLA